MNLQYFLLLVPCSSTKIIKKCVKYYIIAKVGSKIYIILGIFFYLSTPLLGEFLICHSDILKATPGNAERIHDSKYAVTSCSFFAEFNVNLGFRVASTTMSV